MGIVLGVVNLAEDYLNPPINNIGKLLKHFVTTVEEFSIKVSLVFILGVAGLFILKKKFKKLPTLSAVLIIFIIIRV